MALTPSTMLELGTPAPDFALPPVNDSGTGVSPGTGRRLVRRADFAGKPLLVMFICNHCPYVKHIRQHLAGFTREYLDKGVGIVAINSNDDDAYPDDSPEKMAEEARTYGYRFPYLFDETQAVAKAYRAACTPDFFLFDAGHKLVYRGQYDDSRPESGIPVTGKDLRAALDAVLAGKSVSPEQRPSMGCNIKWKPGNAPDYFG